MKTEMLICDCSSTEHQMVIRTLENEPELYVHIHLNPIRFWGRVKLGLGYIFGRKCRYGNWEELILTKEHLPQLKNIVNHFEKQI